MAPSFSGSVCAIPPQPHHHPSSFLYTLLRFFGGENLIGEGKETDGWMDERHGCVCVCPADFARDRRVFAVLID